MMKLLGSRMACQVTAHERPAKNPRINGHQRRSVTAVAQLSKQAKAPAVQRAGHCSQAACMVSLRRDDGEGHGGVSRDGHEATRRRRAVAELPVPVNPQQYTAPFEATTPQV